MGTQHWLREPGKVVYVWVTGLVAHVLLASITGSRSTVFLPPGQWWQSQLPALSAWYTDLVTQDTGSKIYYTSLGDWSAS